MILDCRDTHNPLHDVESDVVIVGAGPVGIYLSNLIIRSGRSVALIEAGGMVSQIMADGGGARSTGVKHAGTTMGRAFGIGGTSAYWGGQLDELIDVDLVRTDRAWPIAHSELLEYYRRVYDKLGLEPTKPREEYLRLLKIEDVADPDIEQYFTSWLKEPNFARLYLNGLKDSSNLTIIVNAVAQDIYFEAGSGEAKWIEASTIKGSRVRVKGRTFVFCAGTIANAQFFLTTQVTSDVPWKRNHAVGRRFHDHISFRVASVNVTNKAKFGQYFENGFGGGRKLQPKLRYRRPLQQGSPISICGMFDFKSSISAYLGNIKTVVKSLRSGLINSSILGLPRDVYSVGRSIVPVASRFLMQKRIKAFADLGIDLVVQSEQFVSDQSRIVVRDAPKMPNGLYRVDVDWRVTGEELQPIRAFTAKVDAFLRTGGLGSLTISKELDRNDIHFLNGMHDTYHMSGGLLMNDSETSGVTDNLGRVWGSKNVYIAGACIFPSSGYANTTLTALAMGHRTAETILKELS